jgi:hypothetical protein
VQTEIPLVKQTLSDVVWAVRGAGVHAERYGRRTGESVPLTLRPSGATSPVHGFAQLARFVPGARDVLAAVDDDVAFAVLPATTDGRAVMFEDQYLCTGGELYELIAGHDRYTADVRPLTAALLEAAGRPAKRCPPLRPVYGAHRHRGGRHRHRRDRWRARRTARRADRTPTPTSARWSSRLQSALHARGLL